MDVRTSVTEAIVAMLEQGVGPWQRPWAALAQSGIPRNVATGQAYRGLNVLTLWAAAEARAFPVNEWMTFNQAKAAGASVRKGAKGVMCVFWKSSPRGAQAPAAEEGGDAEAGKAARLGAPLLKPFWLFNVAEIDGLPARTAQERASEFAPIEAAQALLAASGATIRHGGNEAFYAPAADAICLPEPGAFASREAYYGTALHELVHWTGHGSRCARQFGRRFGDDAHAAEELVAEIGSAMLMAHLGLEAATLDNHARYVGSWLSVLRNDKNAVFTAARLAQAAVDYLLPVQVEPGAQPQPVDAALAEAC